MDTDISGGSATADRPPTAGGDRFGGGGGSPLPPGGGFGFHVVPVEEPLDPSDLREGDWVLAVFEQRPFAFLAPPAAAAASQAPSVLDYLRQRRGGYVAPLDRYEQVFDGALRRSDQSRSIVVFDTRGVKDRGPDLGVQPSVLVGLFDRTCLLNDDPPPGTPCAGCRCAVADLDE